MFGQHEGVSHINRVLRWLKAVETSSRALLNVTLYQRNGEFVGVNCCVVYRDDYLTWYDTHKASGLGIASAINNLTDVSYLGVIMVRPLMGMNTSGIFFLSVFV